MENNLEQLKGQNVVICDLDGTLCDTSHRVHFLKGEPKDWKRFYENMYKDEIIPEIYQIVSGLQVAGNHVVFITGRPEEYREMTEWWLKKNFKYPYIALLMRPTGDHRADTEVKSELYEQNLRGMTVTNVFEDRLSVIRMWKSKGLKVLECGTGEEF